MKKPGVSIEKEIGTGRIYTWIWLFLAVWAILLIWGVLSTTFLPVRLTLVFQSPQLTFESFTPGWKTGSLGHKILSPWLRWDTLWYLQIARDGFNANQAYVAFPPLYPLSARWIGSFLGGNYLLGALVVSWVCCFGACSLLADRAVSEGKEPGRGIRLFLFFPTAFFLFAGYTESLFLLLVLLAWREADCGRWWWVGLIGAAAILTRFIGVLFIIPLGVIWLHQFRAKSQKLFSVLWLLPMPLAYFGWFWFTKSIYGINPSNAMLLHWAQHFDLPWVGLFGSISAIFSRPISEVFFAYMDLLAVIVAAVSGSWLLFKRKYPESLFILSFVLISLVKVTDMGLLGSTSRFVIPLFPMYLYQPGWMRHPVWGRVVLYSAVLLWLFCSALFFTWNWIG